MFFFLAGGINQQVRQIVKREAGKCINCGSPADIVEYDKVLKLFFVPVWRWPGKDQAMHCDNCNLFFPANSGGRRCGYCAKPVESGFRFCPFCGSAL